MYKKYNWFKNIKIIKQRKEKKWKKGKKNPQNCKSPMKRQRFVTVESVTEYTHIHP